jgi:uncharacterized protein (DUF58 family)
MRAPTAPFRASLSGLSRMLGRHGGTRGDAAGASWPHGDTGALLDSTFMRQLENLRFVAPRTATAGLAGEHMSRRSAHAVEFADYRGYVPGDDIRRVDWNVYARLGDLCLKLSEAQENLCVHLLLDCSASMDWGHPNKLQYAKRAAAALGALALVGYDTVYLGVCSGDLQAASPPLRGRHALGDMVKYLQRLAPDPVTNLGRATASYCASHRGRGMAVLLTDCMVSAGHAEALAYLTRAGLRTTVLHILDVREQRPDLEGLLELRDCETGEIVKVGITGDVLRRYATQFQAWSDELAAMCRAHRAGYVQVSTDVPPTTLILQTLRRQGVLR